MISPYINRFVPSQKLLFFLLISIFSCRQEYATSAKPEVPNDSIFSNPIDKGAVDRKIISEASGIAKSIDNPGDFWTHNDSGGKPELYLIDSTGQIVQTLYLNNTQNRDWEDIATGPGPLEGQSYIYVADIGDNLGAHASCKIYRLPEPTFKASDAKKDTIRQVDVIEYVYPDGPRDAETLMIDPITTDIYIVSKRDSHSRIYKATFPQRTSNVFTIEKTGEIPIPIGGIFDQIVGGDISPDGMEILLKSYVSIYYWRRASVSTSITNLLNMPPIKLPYVVEPQGEAIGFSYSGNGYYTLSESQGGSVPHLYKYQRKAEN